MSAATALFKQWQAESRTYRALYAAHGRDPSYHNTLDDQWAKCERIWSCYEDELIREGRAR